MKTLTTIKAWILIICSTTIVSSATEHASSRHNVSHHGSGISQKKYQNTFVPFGIQIPEHVLSTQDVACISADSNIFEMMNKAQESCNGTDMRCTFYHFVNHGYQNIGTLDIDKELFDDLLMKFDNWLITTENIEKYDVPLDGKTKEDSALYTANIYVDGSYINEGKMEYSTNVSGTEKLYTNQNVHVDKVDHNTDESYDNKIVNTHHIKKNDETHHKNHHHKWKNGNHIKLVPEYNNEHRYFEVFLPKDKETGKPRTIYVEVDRDKNEFVILDEEIDKKLNGNKPIRIELDELSEIADTAFNNIAKSSNHRDHIYNKKDDDRIMTSDIDSYSAINEDARNLDIDVEESTQNILNPSICNINANQQLIPDNTTGNVKKFVNVSKNLVVPKKYINQAQFYIESQIDNVTDEIPNGHLELLENTNETDTHQTSFYAETPLDTIEFNENNTNIDLDLDNIECSLENFSIPCDDNSTENYEFSTEHDIVTFDNDSYLQLEENNDTAIDIDFDDTHEFSSSETIHLVKPISQAEKFVQNNKLKSTPITSCSTAGISDYTSSQITTIPSENRQGHTDLQEHCPKPSIPISPYTTVPILGKDLAKVLETESHLNYLFPAYATLGLPADASQNSLLNTDLEHPDITSCNSPLESDLGHQTSRPLSTIFPSPPVECVVKLNKGSKYSPLNFGFSWLPSYSRIEQLRLPYVVNALPQGSIMSLPEFENKPLTDSICSDPSSSDHTTPVETPRLFQAVPSLNVNIQEPSLTTEPYHLEADAAPKPVFPSKLDLPKSNTDLDRISTTYQLSETPLTVIPDSFKYAVNSPCPMQQIPPYLHLTMPNQMDLEFTKYSPFDNNSKETMIPCAANRNRYPYSSFPCFANPYLKPPQFITPFLKPLPSVAPLQPASKTPTLDSLPLSSDQRYPCLNGDYAKATTPIPLLPFAPNTLFLPTSPQLLDPGFVPNISPYQNLWNNIPYLTCTILPGQNIKKYPPIVNNYLTPSADLQQNQILKPLITKAVSLSAPEQPCPTNNILEMIPSSYTPSLSIYALPVQKDLNPPFALERDLQSLSLKYGIPLSKILNSLETEMQNSSPTLEAPYSNLVSDSSLISKPILSKTNAVLDHENRTGYEESLLESDLTNLVPIDSTLIGPHLEIESSLMLESNDSHSYTVLSETTVPPSLHSTFENPPTKVIHDSSLIGPHLSRLSTSNFVLSDENRNANEGVISESDFSNLIPLDSYLIDPRLEIGSPPIVLDSNNSQYDILTSHTEVPITITSQIEPKLNILNQPTNLLLDSSLIGSHLPSLSPVKSLLSDELQAINDMIPLETSLTDLTTLDSSAIDTQDYFVNKLQQSEIIQLEKTAVTLSAAPASPDLHKPSEFLPTNLVEEQLLLNPVSSRLIPLDPSLIGPELKLGSLPIITNSIEDKTLPQVSKESLQNTDNKIEEMESIIVPSSLLPTLLNKPVKADSNFNIITQETKLNEELDELSLDTNVLTDISPILFKETDFEIVEQIPDLPSLIGDRNIPLLIKDSTTLKHESQSDITHVVDSSIHLDSSLIGPSILRETDSREILPILYSVNHLKSSLPTTIKNQNEKPSEILTSINFPVPLESYLKGQTILQHEINSQETSNALDSVTKFDKSLVGSLHETKESSATSPVFASKSQLDSSLEVCRAVNSKDLLDGSLIIPHLTTLPFSSDEIQMINEELQPESGLANLVPLDSSLVGPHVDFESELERKLVCETTKLPYDLVKVVSPLEPITLPSICTSDQQELLSKFTNAITKSQLLPSELKPCDKLLSSIAKISSDNSYAIPSCKDLQTLTLNTLLNTPLSLQDKLASEFSPMTMTSPAQELSPVRPCLESSYSQTPKTLTELPTYAQGVLQIPFTPNSPLVQMKPLIHRNWLVPQPLNFQNIHQTSPCFRPVVGNIADPLISNALTTEDFQPLIDLDSYSKLNSQLSIANMHTPGDAIAPSSEWTTPLNTLPLNIYIPALPKNNSSVLPSNLDSTIFYSEYNPIVVDDIISLLDEKSIQLLKDMSILPFSQSSITPTIPVFEKGEFVSPLLLDTVPKVNSDFIQTGLLPIPITNPLVPSSIYNPQIHLFDPQNIPYTIQIPNISPCNLQSYSSIPLPSQFSEIIEPAPKLVTLPTESLKASLQQPSSKSCVESPIILPSLSLDTILQMPTALNALNSVPCPLPSEYFIPVCPTYTTPLSNAFTNQILPIYASPLSVSFAKPFSTTITNLPINVPYADGPPLPLPINTYTARPLPPKFSSPLMPLKIKPISDYPYPPTVAHNRPMLSEIPNKPSQTYSNACLTIHGIPTPIATSPGSPNIMNRLPPDMTNPILPVFYEPLSTPYFSPLPKSLTNLGLPAYSGPLAPTSLSTLAPTPSGLLSPSYLSPDIPTCSYSSLPAPINTQTRPSNLLTPAYITSTSPVSSSFSSFSTPLSLNPKIITPELKSRLLNTLPISNAVNPLLNTNQRLPINTKTLPLESYSTQVVNPLLPLSSSQIKQKQTSYLTEEIPSYDVIQESTCTYSNDKDDIFYEELKLNHPLESLSYTLAPEEITEALPSEDFIEQEDLTPYAPVNYCASEPSLQTKLYQHLHLTPYAPLHGKPLLKPLPAPQILPPPSFTESFPENIFDDIRLVHSSSPLKHPVSLPTSILSSPLLKLLTPFSSAPNFPISSPLLHNPCVDTPLSPYNKLPVNEKLQSLSSSPYYSAPSQEIQSVTIDPRELRNIVTPQVTPAFSQIATNEAFVPVSLPITSSKLQPPISPYILDNYIELPSTRYEPKSKTLKSQGSFVKPSPIPNYTQYAAPIMSYVPSLEMSITPQYITHLTPAEALKMPLISPKHISSILPFFNMVEAVKTDVNRPQSSLTPQYSVPVSSLPISKSNPIVSYSNATYSRMSGHIPKQALTNHIIPSSLFMSSDIQTQTNKLSPLHNIPSSPSLSIIDSFETVPFYTPSRPLGTIDNPQNILKPKSPLPSLQYTLPFSSSHYLIQPLQPTDSCQTQPNSNVQYTTKLSPVQGQLYASPSSSPMYTSLPSETVPMQLINKPSAPQYSLPYVPVYDTPIHSSPSGRNPFINPDFKPITEVLSYPIPKNIISSSISTPFKSFLLSSLRPLDTFQEPQNLYSSPITFSAPLYSSSLLNPLVKSRQCQPHIISSNSPYVSQLPIDSVPQLPSTSPLLKPLFTTSQKNVPLIPMHFSNTNIAFPEAFPIEGIPSVTSPDIDLANYFPYDSSNHKYSGLYDTLVSEIPEIVTPINTSSTTSYNFFKTPFYKHFKSPVSAPKNLLSYSNYEFVEPSPKLPIRANIVYTSKPVEVSVTSASESSPTSLELLDTETIEKIEPYELMPDSKHRYPTLTSCQNQQRQLHPIFNTKYLPGPQTSHSRLPLLHGISQVSPSKIPSFNAPLLLSDAAELIDTTDFIPVSQIKSEPLISNFDGHILQPTVSSTDRKVPIPNTLTNILEPDVLQLLPHTTLLNTNVLPPTYKQLRPKFHTPRYNKQIPQSSPVYISPQEYKDLIQGLSLTQTSSSSPVISFTNTAPQLITNPLTGGPSPQIPFYTSPMSKTTDNWLSSPIFKNFLPLQEKFLEVKPEKESILTHLDKYRPANKITPEDYNYLYEPKSTIFQVFSELDSVKPINPLLKSKEHYTEYIEDLKSNEDNDYDPELDNLTSNDNKPDGFETKSFTKILPEVIKGLNVDIYNKIAQIPQRLSKLDHFYANNHIGKRPLVLNVPTYNSLPLSSPNYDKSTSAITPPEMFKDFTGIPTKHFGSAPKLNSNSLRPNEYYPIIADSPENIPITNAYSENTLNPCLKFCLQMKSPLNTIETADTSELTPTSYTPYNNNDGIKYSGYKTYQIPSLISPLTTKNLAIPTQMYSPPEVTYSSSIPAVKTSNVQQNPSHSNVYRTTEISKSLISQYQTPIKMATPLQTKLGLDTLQGNPKFNEYNLVEDIIPISADIINEDNDLKTSLINYINKREDVKNNLSNNNVELTIPIGNIAITKKEPSNANTIETNNPSIGLKVWKSNVKIAQAELKLKFKDLSANNFMPIVNNLDKYDMEEIRKIVKNYIDEKYGNHIEINEPYTIDNKFTVIKDFDPNAVDSKYNLLWPTNYV